jgi:hypothetical protein
MASRTKSISNRDAKTLARQINRRFAARESPRAPPAGAGKQRGAENFCPARAFAPSCAAKLAFRLPRALYNSTGRVNQPPRKVHSRATACRSLSSAPPTSRRRRPPRAAAALLALPRTAQPLPSTRCRPAAAQSPATAASERGPTERSTRRSASARSASASAPSRRRTRRRVRTTRSPGASAARAGR